MCRHTSVRTIDHILHHLPHYSRKFQGRSSSLDLFGLEILQGFLSIRKESGWWVQRINHVSSGVRWWVTHSKQRTNNEIKSRADLLPLKHWGPKWLTGWVQPTAEPASSRPEPVGHTLASHCTQPKENCWWAERVSPVFPLPPHPCTPILPPFYTDLTFLPRTVASRCFSEKVRDEDSKTWAGCDPALRGSLPKFN